MVGRSETSMLYYTKILGSPQTAPEVWQNPSKATLQATTWGWKPCGRGAHVQDDRLPSKTPWNNIPEVFAQDLESSMGRNFTCHHGASSKSKIQVMNTISFTMNFIYRSLDYLTNNLQPFILTEKGPLAWWMMGKKLQSLLHNVCVVLVPALMSEKACFSLYVYVHSLISKTLSTCLTLTLLHTVWRKKTSLQKQK